jgi:hypothetical protein
VLPSRLRFEPVNRPTHRMLHLRVGRHGAVRSRDLQLKRPRITTSAPVHHAVTTGVDGHVRQVVGERASRSSRKRSQQVDAPQATRMRLRTPRDPSVAILSSCTHRRGWTASWSLQGDPSMTSPDTSSGRRRASTRPSRPPRLCPTMVTGAAVRSTISSSRAPRCTAIDSEHARLQAIVESHTSYPDASRCCLSRRSQRSPANRPGINSTGRPPAGVRAGSQLPAILRAALIVGTISHHIGGRQRRGRRAQTFVVLTVAFDTRSPGARQTAIKPALGRGFPASQAVPLRHA